MQFRIEAVRTGPATTSSLRIAQARHRFPGAPRWSTDPRGRMILHAARVSWRDAEGRSQGLGEFVPGTTYRVVVMPRVRFGLAYAPARVGTPRRVGTAIAPPDGAWRPSKPIARRLQDNLDAARRGVDVVPARERPFEPEAVHGLEDAAPGARVPVRREPDGGSTDVHVERIGSVGVASAQGARSAMEDAHFVLQLSVPTAAGDVDVRLQGVADGHGGHGVAQGVAAEVGEVVRRCLARHGQLGLGPSAVYRALKDAMAELDRRCPAWAGPDCGSTVNLSLVIADDLYVANVGDSRAVLVTPQGAVQMSEDAKPDTPRYAREIVKRGGVVFRPVAGGPARVNGVLAVARAIGDHRLGAAISPLPKITRYHLPPEGQARAGYAIVHACDGVFDVASSREVASAVQSRGATDPAERIAARIVAAAYRAGSSDNLSAMVVPLGPAAA